MANLDFEGRVKKLEK